MFLMEIFDFCVRKKAEGERTRKTNTRLSIFLSKNEILNEVTTCFYQSFPLLFVPD